MNRNKLLKHLVFLMFFIFVMNIFALKFYWYFSIWYFDIIMHSLSGFWVGVFFLYVFERRKLVAPDTNLFTKVILATFIIGIIWEVYEFYIFQHIGMMPFDIFDTLSDIFFDLLGVLMSILYFSKFIMLNEQNKIQ